MVGTISGKANLVLREMKQNNDDQEEQDMHHFFEEVRDILKKRLSLFVWQGFFAPLEIRDLTEEIVTIHSPTSFHKNWVKDHYMPELEAAVWQALNKKIKINLISDAQENMPASVRKKASRSKSKQTINLPSQEEAQVNKDKVSAEQITEAWPDTNNETKISCLNNKYSFENFVQGPSNQMCFSAAMAVAEHPGQQFSPLFIFGGVGLGKTHLMHAIGNLAKKANPKLKVDFLSAEQWVNGYIKSIRERSFDTFRDRFRNDVDLLLIDDIQFLAGKDASQDEFFHTFNSLHAAKKQIVVASDKYPHEIEGLEERLKTRLSWGLVADIRPPEIETRIAILHKKAESIGATFDEEVFNVLASSITSSVRELEGALMRLYAYSKFNKGALKPEKAKEFLMPMIKKRQVSASGHNVLEEVAKYYDLTTKDLVGKSRQKQIVFARQVGMTCCRNMLTLSFPQIGKLFGGRDHSTVISSIKKIEKYKKEDLSLQATISKLEARIASLGK